MTAGHELQQQIQREKIINYYNEAQKYYYVMWHGNSLGLHYGFWDDRVKTRKEAILKENEVLANLVKIKSGDLVLDAGNGVGGSGIWLAENRGAKVVGLNLIHKQLREAKRQNKIRRLVGKNIMHMGSYQEMPYANNTFDVVWSLESIEHATDVANFIKESFRVLKPGGKIVIAGTFKGKEAVSNEENRQLDVGMSAAGAFNDFRSSADVAGIMENAGFQKVDNWDFTNSIMKSAVQMRNMCILGLPVAKVLNKASDFFDTKMKSLMEENHIEENNFTRFLDKFRVSDIMVKNNQWGIYQEGLFKSGATSYNVIVAQKP